MKIARPAFAALIATMVAAASVTILPEGFAAPVLTVDAADLKIDTAKGLRTYEGKPFTGIAVKHHANGKLALSDSFVDGKRDGQSKMWLPNGQLGYETEFKGGLREGQSRTWWGNGNKRTETHFIGDKQEGAAWAWYSTGEIFERRNFKGGSPEGLQKAWRKNGKLFENFEIRGGRSYGLRNSKICYEVKDQDV